jgi:tryptophanyl-tRNA synthetase
MAKELSNITTEEIEEALKPLLKTYSIVSKFSIRQKFIDILDERGIKLSKEEAIMIHVGDDSDNYSKKINKIMFDKGYILSTHSYSRHLY